MSRIGKEPIAVPSGVDVSISGQHVKVKGSKGELEMDLPGGITVSQEGEELQVARPDDERENKAFHGLSRTLLSNMIHGVTEGYMKELQIVGVGYRAKAKGKDGLELSLGFSHTVDVLAPEGVEFEVPEPTQIIIRGIDKQAVGQTAADIRSLRKPEPYKGKGIKYVDEHIIRKAGKAAK